MKKMELVPCAGNFLVKYTVKIMCVLFCSLLLYGCAQKAPSADYINFIYSSQSEKEAAFLMSIFNREDFSAYGLHLLPEESETPLVPAIYVEFFYSWENQTESDDIIITKNIFIPVDDVLAGRLNTSFQACIDGRETLIQVDEIVPPFTALRVNGLALGDEGYPLVWVTGARIRVDENVRTSRLFSENLSRLKNAFASAPKPDVQSMPDILWITAGGDTMLERGATEALLLDGPASIFGRTAPMIASADVALLNLEGVVSAKGVRVPKSYNFRFIPEVAPALKAAGIDAVLHANNHVFDYGMDAFLDSLHNLKQAGIGVVGAGINDDEASDPYVYRKGEDVVRVFGLASFPREGNGWDGETAAAGPDIAGMLHARRGGVDKLKSKMSANDQSINIVFFHGGIEWSTRPDAATRQLYTDLIASGADLIIGTHPHIVQGFEWVMGKPVFWSIGNYVFGQMNGYYTGDEGLFIRLGYYHGRPVYIEPYPIFLDDIRTDIVSHDNLDVFYARSRDLRR